MADSTATAAAAAAAFDNRKDRFEEEEEGHEDDHEEDDHEDDDDDVDDPTDGAIRPIGEETRHRIISGQAVTDLASAVKELVENALDAGSGSINSKFLSFMN